MENTVTELKVDGNILYIINTPSDEATEEITKMARYYWCMSEGRSELDESKDGMNLAVSGNSCNYTFSIDSISARAVCELLTD